MEKPRPLAKTAQRKVPGETEEQGRIYPSLAVKSCILKLKQMQQVWCSSALLSVWRQKV